MTVKSIRELMIVWTPADDTEPGEVKVGPWPDYNRRLEPYLCSEGACYAAVAHATPQELTTYVFRVFDAVVRSGIPASDAHDAFMQIKEYRKAMPPNLRHLLNLNCAPGKRSSGPSQNATLKKAA